MNIILTTPDDLRRLIREELAAHDPPAPEPGGLIKLPKAADMFDISVRALERMGKEGQINIFQASPGGDRRVDPAQVRAALAGEKTTHMSVASLSQLCQHDRSVTNRICDDCGSVITYVPDDRLE